MGAALIRVSQARDTYNREDVQQLVNAITELQKLVMAMQLYPIVDGDTGENMKIQVNSGVVEAVNA